MLATVINAGLILFGSLLGLALRNKIKERYTKILGLGLGLCVMIIGVTGATGINAGAVNKVDMLCVIVCVVLGSLLGEWLRIEDRLDRLGERLKARVMRGREAGRFTEGFMSATLIFCVGSMAIMGSMEAGINHDFHILLAKSVIDCVTAVSFAATMGVGVCFSALGVLVYQGLLTALFMLVGPFLPDAVITEMSAVGGLLIIAIGLNMLGATKDRIKTGNMLPAIFLPIAYVPLADWIGKLF